MATTDVHGFLKWLAGLSQFDVVFNDLLDQLEVKLGLEVLSRVLTAPPGAPAAGDRYIMPGGVLTGAWSGFAEDDIVIYRAGSWVAFAPIGGQVAWDKGASEGLTFESSTGWSVTSADLSGYATTADLAGLIDYQGSYNASTNTPDLDTTPSGILQGQMWECSAAGAFFAFALDIGDIIIAKQDDPTTEAHWIINKKAGGGGGGGLTPVFITDADSPYTASAGELVYCNSTAGAITVELPATPGDADRVRVVDSAGAAAANNITIDGNGETVNGDATFVLDLNFGQFDGAYNGTGTDWEHALSGGSLTEANVNDLTSGIETFFFAASLFNVAGAVSPATVVQSGASTYPQMSGLAFTAGAFDRAWMPLVMPPRWDAGTFRFRAVWSAASTNVGTVVWHVRANAVGDLEALPVDSASPLASTDTSSGTIDVIQFSPWSSWGALDGSPTIDDLLPIRLSRGTDTFTGEAELWGIQLQWTSNAPTDD